MKIFIVGKLTNESMQMSYVRAFLKLGHEVIAFDEQGTYLKTPLAKNRYFHRLFWHLLALPLQKKLIEEAVSAKPDLVFIFKGGLIKPGTLLAIKKRLSTAMLFNFNGDSPFNTWHHGNSNNWIRSSIPIYDAYLMWGKFLGEPLKKAGARRFSYLACGYDPALHYPVKVISAEKDFYGSDVAFIGSWDEEREWWLNQLLDYNLKIWGNHWEKAGKKIRKKWQGKAVAGEDYSKTCNASKIVLNFIRKQNRPAHNMKTFEIPACGGFMLSTRTEEAVGFFEEGREAAYFSSPAELRKKIDYYLNHERERQNTAKAAHDRLIKSPYSYLDRARQVVGLYKEIRKLTG